MLTLATALLQKIEALLNKMPLYLHALLSLLIYILTRLSNIVLDNSYAASQYPVAFYVGQLSFNGETLRGYYHYMLEQGTLGIYWRTQYIDFVFILATFLSGIIISLWLARLHKKPGFLYRSSLLAAIALPLGALLDASENLVSFVMLGQIESFPDWLAVVYSSLALLKFLAMFFAYILWCISLLGFGLGQFKRLWRSRG